MVTPGVFVGDAGHADEALDVAFVPSSLNVLFMEYGHTAAQSTVTVHGARRCRGEVGWHVAPTAVLQTWSRGAGDHAGPRCPSVHAGIPGGESFQTKGLWIAQWWPGFNSDTFGQFGPVLGADLPTQAGGALSTTAHRAHSSETDGSSLAMRR